MFVVTLTKLCRLVESKLLLIAEYPSNSTKPDLDCLITSKIIFSPGLKLDVSDWETFEGSMLVRWVSSYLSEDDQLKMQLTDQDFK